MIPKISLFEIHNSDINIPLHNFNLNNIDKDYVISRYKDGRILSKYSDNIWDFSPYKSNPSQTTIIDFDKLKYIEFIEESKKIIFIVLLLGSAKGGSQFSVSTIRSYFMSGILPLSKFAKENNTTIKHIFENDKFLIKYINEYCITSEKNQILSSILSFLDIHDNKIININYSKNSKVLNKIKQNRNLYLSIKNQTDLIPSRILYESINQRWNQIKDIEDNLINLISFFKEYIKYEIFAVSEINFKKLRYKYKNIVPWKNAVEKHNLHNLFFKYNVFSRNSFSSFLTNLQGTCKHLVHAYTGMRSGEILNMRNDCLEIISSDSGICRVISSTSKLVGTNKKTKWITSKEIEKVIYILNSINSVIAETYNHNVSDLPLFISGIFFRNKNDIKSSRIKSKRMFNSNEQLPLDNSVISLTKNDIKELQEIDFRNNMRTYEIGENWIFKSHQYRRSLAVYAIRSGIISLGSLQIQLKHLFKEMTLYYSNGSSYANKLFEIPTDHIASEFDKVKPELETLAYIKNVLFSNEKLFGAQGHFHEKNFNRNNTNFKTYFFKNRTETLKQFKNGEISYSETALGACLSTEACDNKLIKSFISCLDCEKGILKKSKIDYVIKKQKQFLKSLEKNSIEYRTEKNELLTLEKFYKELKNE